MPCFGVRRARIYVVGHPEESRYFRKRILPVFSFRWQEESCGWLAAFAEHRTAQPTEGGWSERLYLPFHLLHIEHFVGGAEAEGFIEAAGGIGAVKCNHAQVAAVGFGQAAIDKRMGQAASAELGVDKDVEQVAPVFAGRMERMRWPVEHQQSG